MNTPDDPGIDTTAVDDNMTDAERAAYDEGETPVEPAIAAEAAIAAEPEPPVTPSAEDRLGAAADKLATAAEALASARAEPEPVATTPAEPAEPAVVARNFDEELSAIDTAYDEGEIELREYNRKRDEVRDAQTEQRIEARLAADRTARTEAERAAAENAGKAAWEKATQTFFADPSNAALVGDEIKTAAFQAAINMAGKEIGTGDWTAVLTRARELVGGAPAGNAQEAVRDAVHSRQQQEPAGVQTLRGAPNSGSMGDVPGAALDNLPISDLEDRVIQMKAGDVDAWLAGAPGGLGDHPRQTG